MDLLQSEGMARAECTHIRCRGGGEERNKKCSIIHKSMQKGEQPATKAGLG